MKLLKEQQMVVTGRSHDIAWWQRLDMSGGFWGRRDGEILEVAMRNNKKKYLITFRTCDTWGMEKSFETGKTVSLSLSLISLEQARS